MTQRSNHRVPPSWTRPGSRWGLWFYSLMLCVSIGLLVWRVIDGDGTGRILMTSCLILVWVCLLVANLTARHRPTAPLTPPS